MIWAVRRSRSAIGSDNASGSWIEAMTGRILGEWDGECQSRGAVGIVALDLGPLPVAKINSVLGLNLTAADAHFSIRAQSHAQMRHPGDFELCRQYAGGS